MFERYTEPAFRVVFFARYEAAQLGSSSIGTEHLLLGLIRENSGLTARLFRERNVSSRDVRATRRPAAGCDQQRLPKAIGPASASVSGTVAS
ncbi:MAG TPA: Clp protease N-terminal domain-containing protein [Vicinamibacteria bacterium]|jgi:hypothetical protein|nr:Clp protease N-terminal domain-containing protein [Vicinamibacteria bacterium]